MLPIAVIVTSFFSTNDHVLSECGQFKQHDPHQPDGQARHDAQYDGGRDHVNPTSHQIDEVLPRVPHFNVLHNQVRSHFILR